MTRRHTHGERQLVDFYFCQILFGFHPFGNHLESELVRHHNNGIGQCQDAGVGRNVAGKRLVDLQIINIEFLRARQRRIAGAEIVDGDLDTGFT